MQEEERENKVRIMVNKSAKGRNKDHVGRLAKATFVYFSHHTYSSNVASVSKPNLEINNRIFSTSAYYCRI